MSLRLSQTIINERLKERPLRMIGVYINSNSPTDFQCINCNYIWKARPTNIEYNNQGCPQCAGNARHNNQWVDINLEVTGRSILRLGQYNGMHAKINWQCVKCQNIWSATPANIINGNCGCPICSVPRQNEKRIIQFLKSLNINFKFNCNIKNINVKAKKNFRVDFYFPRCNLIIEYNGEQHYKPSTFGHMSKKDAKLKFIQQLSRDKYIDKFCKSNNITIIWIDGRKYVG